MSPSPTIDADLGEALGENEHDIARGDRRRHPAPHREDLSARQATRAARRPSEGSRLRPGGVPGRRHAAAEARARRLRPGQDIQGMDSLFQRGWRFAARRFQRRLTRNGHQAPGCAGREGLARREGRADPRFRHDRPPGLRHRRSGALSDPDEEDQQREPADPAPRAVRDWLEGRAHSSRDQGRDGRKPARSALLVDDRVSIGQRRAQDGDQILSQAMPRADHEAAERSAAQFPPRCVDQGTLGAGGLLRFPGPASHLDINERRTLDDRVERGGCTVLQGGDDHHSEAEILVAGARRVRREPLVHALARAARAPPARCGQPRAPRGLRGNLEAPARAQRRAATRTDRRREAFRHHEVRNRTGPPPQSEACLSFIFTHDCRSERKRRGGAGMASLFSPGKRRGPARSRRSLPSPGRLRG